MNQWLASTNLYGLDQGADGVTLAEKVFVGDHVVATQDQFILLVIIDNDFKVAHVVHLAVKDLAYHVLVLVVQFRRIKLLHLLDQGLTERKDESTAHV